MRSLLLFLCILVPAFTQSVSPFGFEPNLGQFPPTVRFVRRSSGNPIYVTRDALVLPNRIRLQIAGVDPDVVPMGDSAPSTAYNFYEGSNPSNWRTNVRLFGGVRLANIYPGVSALFTAPMLNPLAPGLLDRGKLILTIQPGADLERFRLRVLNTGAIPFEGPSGIWFVGGNIPGVFNVTAETTQTDGGKRVAILSSLKIESPELLSIEVPGRNPALPTEVEISFPGYDFSNSPPPARASDGNRYVASYVEQPVDFGEDGRLYSTAGGGRGHDGILTRLDDSGKAIWVSLFGGAGDDFVSFPTPTMDGVAVSGTTDSSDLPVTSTAPRSKLSSTRDVFLAFFNRESGRLLNATYLGIEGVAWPLQQMSDSGRELAVGGGIQTGDSSLAERRGYLVRWNPGENRFVFSLRFDSPVTSIAFDAISNLYFASANPLVSSFRLAVGVVDASGKQQGPLVTIDAPAGFEDARFNDVRLLPAGGGDFWAAYQLVRPEAHDSGPQLAIAKILSARGQVVLNRVIATAGSLAGFAFTPAGNLKLLVQNTNATE
ncbi:MAG TPA: hypothetical protein VMZ52_02755, partial [Bryobacteraceae bacterium]|nr:hypothetical protein [Bryobacteraceae bacterium]